MGLKVGVLGFDPDQTYIGMREVAESDYINKIKTISIDHIIMDDGTEYIAIYPNAEKVVGYKLDQLIVVDYASWNIFAKLGELIDGLRQRLLFYSYVPEEYQIQRFEW
jgi:hypothetical protein